jgi:hypothetical protein
MDCCGDGWLFRWLGKFYLRGFEGDKDLLCLPGPPELICFFCTIHVRPTIQSSIFPLVVEAVVSCSPDCCYCYYYCLFHAAL